MDIKYYPTAKDFLSHAGNRLARDEARYGLTLGLAKRLVKNPHWYGQTDPWFCTVSSKNSLCAVAMRTPPFKVLLAYVSGKGAIPWIIRSPCPGTPLLDSCLRGNDNKKFYLKSFDDGTLSSARKDFT